ncbi:crossover junction endodeoxyribonuclease RuvC [Paenibacillus bouchesdurhonensis]|uniref:crossover junction endodeoxyribonuclease RuvC n=1 Tax=Paenibacillus bouchesdurhonensis TaxID=1870990 RepID=UPI000DA639B9|nr:crossover junction endodeoxyribonuclease RuvC [Paenibacillus bouchesdurhonensis]
MTRFVGIDPSTKTGVVILDHDGNILDTMEITAKGQDPARMADIIETTIEQLEPGDVVAIEGFGFASQSGFLLGGIGWGIRVGMYLQDNQYIEVAPTQVKKFASGKGNTKKDELAVHIYKHWGFESKSDNVRDAFVLAQIARSIRTGVFTTKYQQEVIQAILAPPKSKKSKKAV